MAQAQVSACATQSVSVRWHLRAEGCRDRDLKGLNILNNERTFLLTKERSGGSYQRRDVNRYIL